VIDTLAVQAIVEVLPRLGPDDLPLLDAESFRDFLETPIRYQRAFRGEEAFGLAALADLSDGVRGTSTIEGLRSASDAPAMQPFGGPFSLLYRCFMLPADLAGYREVMSLYRALVDQLASPTTKPFTVVAKEAAAIEEDLRSRRAGVFSSLMAPPLASVLTAQSKGEAQHAAARALVAKRTDTGSIVYSVGPDGADDGGPEPNGAEAAEGNDDVGLRLAF